ncbi:MAG: ion transporter [Bacteroidetes bacterium]|jgi:voltage-gated potassium channel|nr:ion transporter [Bacteroidota bacterium]
MASPAPPSADRPFSLAVSDRFGKSNLSGWRLRGYEIIFESDTPLGKAFDMTLIVIILLSVVAVMLESIGSVHEQYGAWLRAAEWVFTVLFTIEYVVRLICVGRRLRYARSFFGIVDLLAVIPTYLSVLAPGAQYLLVIRLLRVLRVFRVLKLAAYMTEATVLAHALRASRRKIEIFVFTVLTLVCILGSLMYLVEGAENGFTSIPRSVYWAIVTLTTVGYGDISPQTNLGQTLAALIMIIGYGIIAVPTGIVTAELARFGRDTASSPICPECAADEHRTDARYCWRCGTDLQRASAYKHHPS